MSKKPTRLGPARFVLCIESGAYPASLQRRKLYEVRPDTDAERDGQLRVIDDSGEDYLYPREYFQPVQLTPFLKRLVRGDAGGAAKVLRPMRRPTKVRAAR